MCAKLHGSVLVGAGSFGPVAISRQGMIEVTLWCRLAGTVHLRLDITALCRKAWRLARMSSMASIQITMEVRFRRQACKNPLSSGTSSESALPRSGSQIFKSAT